MKRGILIALGIVVVLLTVFLLLRKPAENASQSEAKPVEKKAAPMPIPASPQDKAPQSKEERLEEYGRKITELGMAMNRPITFYGRIIDEEGKPIPGVKANVEVTRFGRIPNASLMPDEKNIELTSDDDGRIQLTDQTGVSIVVRLKPHGNYEFYQEGYYPESFRDVALDVRVTPKTSYEHPHVFPVYTKGEAEPMFRSSLQAYCKPDGSPKYVDMVNRKSSDADNLPQVTMILSSVSGPFENKKVPWSARIEMRDVHLQESDDPFLHVAPIEGYQPLWNLEMNESNPHYRHEAERKFYLKFSDGTYGRMDVRVRAFYGKHGTSFSIKLFKNPSGSRNLRYDETKRATLK